MTFTPKVWNDALSRVQHEIPHFAFDAWIAPLEAKVAEDRLLLGCPTSFHRDRVRSQHLESIQKGLREAIGHEAGESSAAVQVELMTMVEFAETPGRRLEPRGALRSVETAPLARAVNDCDPDPQSVPIAKAEPLPVAAVPVHARIGPKDEFGNPDRASRSNAYVAAPQRGRGAQSISAGIAPAIAPTSAPASAPDRSKYAPSLSDPRAQHAHRSEPRSGHRPDFGLDGQPRGRTEEPFTFENFIVGPANSLAREAALALSRRRQRSLNLLYLAGLSGMGKTHLARAAATEARRQLPAHATPGAKPRARVLYLTAEQFTSEFVSAMRNGRNEAWTQRYRGPIELLVIEDIQLLTGRMRTQQELSQTIAHVLDAGGCVLLTGDRSPRDLTGLDERLREQVGRGFIAELDRPDAIVRRHILRAKADAGGVRLPADCLDLLVEATGEEGVPGANSSSVRDVESLLIQVVTTSSLLGRPVDRALVQEAIDLKRGAAAQLAPRQVEVVEIVEAVASFFGTRIEVLASRSRRRDVLAPRQMAMYLAHRYTDASLAEIGRTFRRDHPSVRNAIKRIERQVLESAPIRYQVESLCEKLDALLARDGSRSSA